MKSILLFGASGNVGKHVAMEARRQGYNVTAVVRNARKAKALAEISQSVIVADVMNPAEVEGLCKNFDVVISALGKSVSPNDNSRATFYEVDFVANARILKDAIVRGVKKFVYVSALHAERYKNVEYFKVHHDFSELLKHSGLDYSIIKPPSIFSAYIDVVDMAKKGKLANLGAGNSRTNPIYEGDLAVICINSISQSKSEIEAGGKETLSRREINEIIQQHANPPKKVLTVPIWVMKVFLPLIRIANKNLFDKFDFFVEVMQHDIVAPPLGQLTLKEYLAMKS